MVYSFLKEKVTAKFPLYFVIFFSITACTEEPIPPELSQVTTSTASATGISTATATATVIDDGRANVTSRGFVWSTSPDPTTGSSTKSSNGTGLGEFTGYISGLSPNTTYFIRAYATNSVGTSYGNELNFTTNPEIPPSVSIGTASEISSVSASIGGEVTVAGTNPVTARGFVFSTSPNPTTDLPGKTTNGTGTGTFSGSLTGLTASTKYYVKAYATSSTGTSYSNEINFTTKSIQSLALVFDGTNDYVEVPTSTDFNLGDNFTLESWVYLEKNAKYQTLIHKWANGAQYTLELYNGKLTFVIATSSNYYVLEDPRWASLTNWIHFAGVKEGNTMKIYVNGLLRSSLQVDGTMNSGNGPLRIGIRSESLVNPIVGKMDEIRIWNIARTAQQIDLGMYSKVDPSSPGLVAYYDFDGEPVANGANSGYNVLKDITGNGHNGTLKNFSLSGSSSNWTSPHPVVSSFSLGNNHMGGIIIYIDGTGRHGLIAAPGDISDYFWGCSSYTNIAHGTAIGTGGQNTIEIYNNCGGYNMARAVYTVAFNDHYDWHVPSIGELAQVFNQRNLLENTGGGFIHSEYWSSSQASTFNGNFQAWFKYASNGSSGLGLTIEYRGIRPVKYF